MAHVSTSEESQVRCDPRKAEQYRRLLRLRSLLADSLSGVRQMNILVPARIKSAVKRFPPLYRAFYRLRGQRLHSATVKIATQRLGTDYGGWRVGLSALNPSKNVYSFGVGENSLFDFCLIYSVAC